MNRTTYLASLLCISLAAGIALGQEAAAGRGGGPGRGRGGAPAQAPGQAPAATQSRPAQPRNDSSVTTGTLKPLDGPQMTYTATAGYLPLKDEQDRLRANIFYVSYNQGAAPAEGTATAAAEPPGSVSTSRPSVSASMTGSLARPVTFVFNGGPGAASVWLHLGAVGPRKLDVPEDGHPPAPPFKVIENPYSWLPATDLVFVDPVNTGYSRAATPEQAREFFGVQEDISAMGEFIRLWLGKNQRWGSPIFLAGESYGTTRAAGLSNYLQERVGVSVSGVILISSVLNFGTLAASESNDLPYALYLPSYAAVAWYHKKVPNPQGSLDALLKNAENFVDNDYIAALAKGATLSEDDRQRIAKRVAEFTGLSTDYVLASNLRIAPSRFEKELLRDKDGTGKVIGRYDGRLTGWATDNTAAGQDYDPSFTGFYESYTTAFNEYVRRTLNYENDLPYEVLSGRVQPWNYSSGGAGGSNGYLYVGDDLRDAMIHNPHLRLLVCSGRFDLATPYFATDYTLNHLNMTPDIRKNITVSYFPGGHMLYHVHAGIEKLYKDVSGFIEK